MATDSISGWQKDIEAFLAVLDPQIRGNENLISASGVSAELVAAVEDPPLADMRDRRSKGQVILDDIDKLLSDIQIFEEDGGTTPLSFTLPADLQSEYDGHIADFEAGAEIFHATMASSLRVTFGNPVPKDPLPARSNKPKE